MPLYNPDGSIFASEKPPSKVSFKGGGKPVVTGGTIKTSSGTVNMGVQTPLEIANQAADLALKNKNLKEGTTAEKNAAEREKKLIELSKTINQTAYKIAEIPGETGVTGRAKGLASNISGFTQSDKKVAGYNSFVAGIRPQLSRGLGDVGNLNIQEQQAAVNLLPLPSDNLEVRSEKLKNFLDFLSFRGVDTKHMTYAKKYVKDITGEEWIAPTLNKITSPKSSSQRFVVNGEEYNIPIGEVAAFKKAKGIK